MTAEQLGTASAPVGGAAGGLEVRHRGPADVTPWGRWATRGVWAIADQALFAGGSLLVNVLLARWLPPNEYGAFATAYAVFLLLVVPYSAMLLEPMLVFGTGTYGAHLSGYLRLALRHHWLLSGAGGLVLALGAAVLWAAGSPLLAQACASLAVATPCMLLTWVTRRACFVRSEVRWAAQGGALSLALTTLAMFGLHASGRLSVATAVLTMAGTSLAAGLWLSARLLRQPGAPLPRGVGERAVREHWRYGRWAMATGVAWWVASNGYFVVLTWTDGLGDAAALRAVLYLVLPVMQANTAIITMLTPTFAQTRDDPAKLRALLARATAVHVLSGLLYGAALVAGSDMVVPLVFGGAYQWDRALLVLVALLPIAEGVGLPFAAALSARVQVRHMFWSVLLAAVAALAVGTVGGWGVRGAVVAMLASWLLRAVIMAYFLRPALSLRR